MSDFRPRPGSEEEWATLLRQLQQQPKAELQPFFYARVRARLLAGAAPAGLPTWLRRPAYAAVLAALVLAVSGDGPAPGTALSRPLGSYPALGQPH